MKLTLIKELFATFLRTRHIARHFRRFVLFDSLQEKVLDREVSPALAQLLIYAAKSTSEELFEQFGSHPDGLSEIQAEKIRESGGLNEIEQEKPLSWRAHLWQCYKTPFDLLLTLLAVISYLTEDIKATIVIASMVVLSVLIRFWQEFQSNQAADKLKAMVSNTATVLRRHALSDGKEEVGISVVAKRVQKLELPIKQLVPGDVIALSAGDMIPADCRVLSARDLFMNQAAMTGESMPVEKYAQLSKGTSTNPLDQENILFMGTNVVSGSAIALIVATGNHTYFGALAQRVTSRERAPTQFQTGVNRVAWLLIRFMLVMVPLVLLINGITKHDWLEAFLFALSIAVGLTPEMLPMIVTSTLAKGAVLLSRRKVIVKRLDAIQNFGAMDVLCTDKTGTLTQDKIFLERHTDVWGEPFDAVLKYAYLNSYYQTGLKNLLDVAVLEKAELPQTFNASSAFRLVDEIPFDFQRRRMSVVVAEHDHHHLLICKGAVEEILHVCKHVRHGEQDELLTPELLARISKVTASLNEEGLRVVAVAVKELPSLKKDYRVSDEAELTLVGYVAFLDPPKETTRPALKALKTHGITVKVLTGDNELVTQKVCREVGLDICGVVLGAEVEVMDDHQLAQKVASCNVFAKLTPAHKERIVRLLKRNGHTVGFMGDGINDAPALRTADIGISVDSGVDIAKEAADIILLEKSLMVLEEGVIEGRKTFANMLKYIKMTASSNFGNVFSVLIASAFIPFLPMLPMHLLVQNLLYDISQIAIPFDNVDEEMLNKPQSWRPAEITRFMLYFGPISSVFDVTTYWVMWFIFGANSPAQQTLFQSGWFMVGLLTQTLVVHMIRTPKIPFIQSRASMPLLLMTAVIMGVGIFLPMGPFAHYFKLQALPPLYFLFMVLTLSLYMAVTQIVKVFYIRRFGWQ